MLAFSEPVEEIVQFNHAIQFMYLALFAPFRASINVTLQIKLPRL